MTRFRLLLPLLLFPLPAWADAIVVTRAMQATTVAEIFVEENGLRTELEIGVADLPAFHNLLPEEIRERMSLPPEPQGARLRRFFEEDWVARPDGGTPLIGKLREMAARPRVRRDEITGEPLPAGEGEPELVVFVVIDYEWSSRPSTITFSAPRAESGPSASVGFVVYHHGLPVNDFRYLGTAETLHLDWDDPFYSRFENRNLRRQFNAPISAYLYVEPYEVRKEIVLRPRDLQAFVDLGLTDRRTIPVELQDALKRDVVDFLSGHSPVTVDGRPVEGDLDRIHFVRRSLRRTGIVDPPEEMDAISATLGIIWVYPLDRLPDEATLEWQLFNERITVIPAAATDEAGALPFMLTAEDPVLVWNNFLTDPNVPELVEVGAPPPARSPALLGLMLLGAGLFVFLAVRAGSGMVRGERPSPKLLLAGAALALVVGLSLPGALRSSSVSDERASEIVTDLLGNVYRAFDYRDEERIYDTLSHSASGDLLTRIYLETQRSLEIENQGGARARVKEIEMIESTSEPLDGSPGFVTHCTWNVAGSVGHWGHIHRRVNRYVARFQIEPMDGAWKFTDLELLQEERL